jgi:hypothetical protein
MKTQIIEQALPKAVIDENTNHRTSSSTGAQKTAPGEERR